MWPNFRAIWSPYLCWFCVCGSSNKLKIPDKKDPRSYGSTKFWGGRDKKDSIGLSFKGELSSVFYSTILIPVKQTFIIIIYRSVAQFGSAYHLGWWGRRFESCHSDRKFRVRKKCVGKRDVTLNLIIQVLRWFFQRWYGQVVRQRIANPLPPVRIWVPPSFLPRSTKENAFSSAGRTLVSKTWCHRFDSYRACCLGCCCLSEIFQSPLTKHSPNL